MKNDNSPVAPKLVTLVRNLAKVALRMLSILRRRLLLAVFNGSVAPKVPGVKAEKKKKERKGLECWVKLDRPDWRPAILNLQSVAKVLGTLNGITFHDEVLLF